MKSLNQQLGVDIRTVLILREAFGLRRHEAEIVGYMLRREYAHPECLYTVIYGALPDCQQPEQKTLLDGIANAAAKLRRYGFNIMNVGPEMGWYITAQDKRSMREIMSRCDVSPECIQSAQRSRFGIVYA